MLVIISVSRAWHQVCVVVVVVVVVFAFATSWFCFLVLAASLFPSQIAHRSALLA